MVFAVHVFWKSTGSSAISIGTFGTPKMLDFFRFPVENDAEIIFVIALFLLRGNGNCFITSVVITVALGALISKISALPKEPTLLVNN